MLSCLTSSSPQRLYSCPCIHPLITRHQLVRSFVRALPPRGRHNHNRTTKRTAPTRPFPVTRAASQEKEHQNRKKGNIPSRASNLVRRNGHLHACTYRQPASQPKPPSQSINAINQSIHLPSTKELTRSSSRHHHTRLHCTYPTTDRQRGNTVLSLTRLSLSPPKVCFGRSSCNRHAVPCALHLASMLSCNLRYAVFP